MANLDRLSDKSRKIVEEIIAHIGKREFENAIEMIRSRLFLQPNADSREDTLLRANLAALLVDIGNEAGQRKLLEEAIRIHENEREAWKMYIGEVGIEYNIGNAKSAIFEISRYEPNFRLRPDSSELLTEAKNHYWRAYKLISPLDEGLRPQLLVNLATSLHIAGRVVEALQYLDEALTLIPDHPEANFNRSEALLSLLKNSHSYSASLLWQVVDGFKLSPNVAKKYGEYARTTSHQIERKLVELGYGDVEIRDYVQVSANEFAAMSRYRQFCISKSLSLSEHALYCRCIGARNDNLTIPLPTIPIGGTFVPMMEHTLNHLKSEFALARYLYYQHVDGHSAELREIDIETLYTELFEGELSGLDSEMLRVSFRLCFGILDKIANAICELFELSNPNENVYFESFWKQSEARWDKLNSLDNKSLMALYSQATDLNTRNGEWGIYKSWRNRLEHGMLNLDSRVDSPEKSLSLLKSEQDSENISLIEFELKTLHMLQLVRSAIFNFVFCVREEALKFSTDGGIPMLLTPKDYSG